MDASAKYIISVLFKLKVYKSDKQNYEDLFTQIMSFSNPNFRNPKPQGILGDGKCDGFDRTTGKYYQVYAPEDLKGKETTLTTKFSKSLNVIINDWKDVSPIKEFYLTVNDKYNGVYQSTEKLLVNLEQQYNISCFPFLVKDLEAVFDSLDDNKKFEIIGSIPSSENIMKVIKYDSLKEAITYLINLDRTLSPSKLPTNINLNSKIVFNKLNPYISDIINHGAWQIGNLDEYFKQNPNDKVILQKVFNKLYNNGLNCIPNTELQKNDIVFYYILNDACNGKTGYIQDAVLILMSYYFGYCDIFEEPPKTTLF